MFKVNNKDARTMPLMPLCRSGVFIINGTYFTPCSTVSIINFEHAIAGWGHDENFGTGFYLFTTLSQNKSVEFS